MGYKKINVKDFSLNPFTTIGKDWILISAKQAEKVNTMTASWGGVGVLWSKNVATVYIRPQRYTKEFVDNSEYFTITFFAEYKSELGVLGKKSGRDGDKIKEVDFDVVMVEKQPTFKQGTMMMICKKIYADEIKPEKFIDSAIDKSIYPLKDYHTMYVGQVVGIYVNEKD